MLNVQNVQTIGHQLNTFAKNFKNWEPPTIPGLPLLDSNCFFPKPFMAKKVLAYSGTIIWNQLTADLSMRKSMNESMNLSLNLTPFEPRGLPKMVKMANIHQKLASILIRYQGFPLKVRFWRNWRIWQKRRTLAKVWRMFLWHGKDSLFRVAILANVFAKIQMRW